MDSERKASVQRVREVLHGGRGAFKSVIHGFIIVGHEGMSPHVGVSVTHLALMSQL